MNKIKEWFKNYFWFVMAAFAVVCSIISVFVCSDIHVVGYALMGIIFLLFDKVQHCENMLRNMQHNTMIAFYDKAEKEWED